MKFLILASAAVLAVAPASAQPAQQPKATPHMSGPAHHAQRVHTRAEVAGHVRTMFARLDADRDGFVTKVEAQAMRQHMRRGAGEAHGQRAGRAFERMDLNRDGAISRAEWDQHAAQRQQRRAAMAAQAAAGGHRMGIAGSMIRGRMFEAADVNRDGRVSLAEAENAALQRFDRLDLNRDGALTPEERRTAREQMRAQRRG